MSRSVVISLVAAALAVLVPCGQAYALAEPQQQTTLIMVGAYPAEPAFTTAERSRLLVVQASGLMRESQRTLAVELGGWAQATFSAVYRTNDDGDYLDDRGRITRDPERYTVDHYQVVSAKVQSWDPDGVVNHPLGDAAGWVAHPDGGVRLGELYWYDADQVHVLDVQLGTRFASPGDVNRFERRWLWNSVPRRFRERGELDAGGVRIGTSMALALPDRSTPVSSLTGGQFAVSGITGRTYVFLEKDLAVDQFPSTDLYALDGYTYLVPHAIEASTSVHWDFLRRGGEIHNAEAYVTTSQPLETLPDDVRALLLGISSNNSDITVVSEAPDLSSVGGQDTATLMLQAEDAMDPSAEREQDLAQIRSQVASDDYFRTDRSGKLLPVIKDTYSDPAMTTLVKSRQGKDNSIASAMTEELAGISQITPEMMEPVEGDRVKLREAVYAVDQELYHQTPSSLPLYDLASVRHARMLPAGRKPFYHEGDPVPGDGDNPTQPRPSVVDAWQPVYDLDGDGDLDRLYTDDPYQNNFDRIILKWSITGDYHRLRDSDSSRDKFALFAYNSEEPEREPTFLFSGQDGTLYMQSQSRLSGKTWHSYALTSHMDPKGEGDEPGRGKYRIALRYVGRSVVNDGAAVEITTTAEYTTWVQHQEVDLPNGETLRFIAQSGAETVTLYDGLGSPEEFVTDDFSDPDFVPRATEGKPTKPAVYDRVVRHFAYIDGAIVEQPAVQTRVVFPADFDPDAIETEDQPNPYVIQNAFEWDYRKRSDGLPWNYHRGDRFPRGSHGRLRMNTQQTRRYFADGQDPHITTAAMVEHGGIGFMVQELTGRNPPPDDPLLTEADNQAIYEQWKQGRANYHSPRDERTDLYVGRPPVQNVPGFGFGRGDEDEEEVEEIDYNKEGERHFEIVEGVGWYLHRGSRYDYASEAEQKALLEEFWEWDLYQPKTVYTVLRTGDDINDPLLNSVTMERGDGTARSLYDPKRGLALQSIAVGGDQSFRDAQRRAELIETQFYFFSGARGREWELEWARRQPKSTRLYCVEWDDMSAVRTALAGREVVFIENDEMESKILGEIITTVYGKVHAQSFMDDPSKRHDLTAAHARVVGDEELVAVANQNPGRYYFAANDYRFDKPANLVQHCAILDDGQYGDPRPDQWRVTWPMQFRHPMIIYYDDRHSTATAAYGENADPATWTAAWGERGDPREAPGLDQGKIAFEHWCEEGTNTDRLTQLYDAMHEGEYAEAAAGELPPIDPPPLPAKPQEPIEPAGWSGGSLVEPPLAPHPGPEPVPQAGEEPQPPWYGQPGFPADIDWATAEQAVWDEAKDKWMGLTVRYDSGSNGHVAVFHLKTVRQGYSEAAFATYPWRDVYWMQPWIQNQWNRSGMIAPRHDWRKWSIRNRARNGSGGGHVSGQDDSRHGNVVLAIIVNDEASRRVRLRFENDDGGGLYWNQSQSNNRRQTSGSTSSENLDVTMRTGLNEFVGAHYESTGYSAYKFLINGSDLASTSAPWRVYPFFPQYLGNGGANMAIQRYRSRHDDWEAQVRADELAQAEWEAAVDRHEKDAEIHAQWQQRKDAHEQWELAFEAAVAQYAIDVSEYQQKLAAYNLAYQAYQRWQEANADQIAAHERWRLYEQARSDWVWLVSRRIAQPGVEWSEQEPTGQGYVFWRDDLGGEL